MLKVDNKNTRTTSMASMTLCSSGSIVDVEQVNVNWVYFALTSTEV